MIRLARANTLTVAQSDYVTASKVLGATKPRIMFGDIAPNVALPLLSYSFVLMAVLIVAEGALAFLGLGLQQPNPSWGNMIAEGGLATLTEVPPHPVGPRRVHVRDRPEPEPRRRAGDGPLEPPRVQPVSRRAMSVGTPNRTPRTRRPRPCWR